MFFYLQVPHVRRAIEKNLTHLLEMSSFERQVYAFRTFTNYCFCIANAYRLHLGAKMDVPCTLSGAEHLKEYLASGKGVILATGHIGNWHLGPYYLEEHGYPPVTVVMSPEPDHNSQAFESAFRDRRMRVVYPDLSALVSLELRAALRRGEFVAFQMDRPSTEGRIRVPCAGHLASFAAGPALLARACEVPVVPVFFPLEGNSVHIIIKPPLFSRRTSNREDDLYQLTSALAQSYSSVIRQFPEQWFTFYDFWGS